MRRPGYHAQSLHEKPPARGCRYARHLIEPPLEFRPLHVDGLDPQPQGLREPPARAGDEWHAVSGRKADRLAMGRSPHAPATSIRDSRGDGIVVFVNMSAGAHRDHGEGCSVCCEPLTRNGRSSPSMPDLCITRSACSRRPIEQPSPRPSSGSASTSPASCGLHDAPWSCSAPPGLRKTGCWPAPSQSRRPLRLEFEPGQRCQPVPLEGHAAPGSRRRPRHDRRCPARRPPVSLAGDHAARGRQGLFADLRRLLRVRDGRPRKHAPRATLGVAAGSGHGAGFERTRPGTRNVGRRALPTTSRSMRSGSSGWPASTDATDTAG